MRVSESARGRWVAALTIAIVAGLGAIAHAAERPRVYALVGGDVVVAPGETIDGGVVVLRDGRIDTVGPAGTAPPADAVAIDVAGHTVYPGLIDPASGLEPPSSGGGNAPGAGGAGSAPGASSRERTPRGPRHPIARVRPEYRSIDHVATFSGDRRATAERLRAVGFTLVSAVPPDGVFRGTSAVVALAEDAPVHRILVRADALHHVAFSGGRFGGGYPTSLMGAVATIRQVLHDAERHATWRARHAANPRALRRPEVVPAYDALAGVVEGASRVMFHATDPDDVLLAARLAREFDLDAVIAASGHEWEAADAIAATGRTLVLPLTTPDRPEIDEDEVLDTSLRAMRRYTRAPGNAAALAERDVPFAFTLAGLSSPAEFRKKLSGTVEAGLDESKALAALTTVPAGILGIDEIAGTLEAGKLANVVVVEGSLFDADAKVRRVFVDGREYVMEASTKPEGDPDAVVDPRGEWSVTLDFGGRSVTRAWTIGGTRDAYSGTAETQSGTVDFDDVAIAGNRLSVRQPIPGGRGAIEIVVIVTGDRFEGVAEMGTRSFELEGRRTSGPPEDEETSR